MVVGQLSRISIRVRNPCTIRILGSCFRIVGQLSKIPAHVRNPDFRILEKLDG